MTIGATDAVSSAQLIAAIAVLSAAGAGGVLYAVLLPHLAGTAHLRKRIRLVARAPSAARGSAGGTAAFRKRSVEDTLKEIDSKQRERARRRSTPTLTETLRQSGLGWTRKTYLVASGIAALATYGLASLGMGAPPAFAAAAALAAGLFLPRFYVGTKRNRRLAAFGNELPNAVDVIVRGVRSGLPLGDCLRVIAAEGQEPVRSEFKMVVDDQTLGVTAPDSMLRLAERVPLAETSFLATVVAVQNKSGGNLTEALANLSSVLRERKKMRGKIRAMSAEAKASAGIIGSLPPVVTTLLFLTSPDYIALLFTTTTGHVVLAVCAVWMMIGILVMRAMINFDF